jgi:hypothetical protein
VRPNHFQVRAYFRRCGEASRPCEALRLRQALEDRIFQPQQNQRHANFLGERLVVSGVDLLPEPPIERMNRAADSAALPNSVLAAVGSLDDLILLPVEFDFFEQRGFESRV